MPLGVPGFITSYGMHANGLVAEMRRNCPYTKSSKYTRLAEPAEGDVGVGPRTMGFALTSAKTKPRDIFSVSNDCNHPSASAYATRFGRAMQGRSYALSLTSGHGFFLVTETWALTRHTSTVPSSH